MRRKYEIIIINFLLMLFSPSLFAQDQDEPLLGELNRTFKKKSLSLATLLQTVADYQSERSFAGSNGFTIAASRLAIKGVLDKGFSYFFQFDFIRPTALLDAKLRYRFSPLIAIDAGIFKSPFSREYLTSAADIDFINRSQVVNALAPKRQIGVQLSGWLIGDVLTYRAGIFNGNGFNGNKNDNENFLYAARLSLYPKIFNRETDQLEIAVNFAQSKDDNVSLGSDLFPNFHGTRELIGIDFRLTYERFLLSGEFIKAKLEPLEQPISEPYGYQVTVGYDVNQKTQFLVRWDSFSPDDLLSDSDLLILGLNYFPTSAIDLQFNYIIPSNSKLENHQILVNFQLSF